MVENLSKNMSDADEYPAMMAMHARCVSIIAHLWGVQKGETAIGSATTGSSEAIHLGGLAMKRRWQEKRDAEGKDKTKPNIIMGSNAQVALEKFARYFEVEARILDVSERSKYRLDPELVKKNIDENTIGVFVSKLPSPSHKFPFPSCLGGWRPFSPLKRPSNYFERETLILESFSYG